MFAMKEKFEKKKLRDWEDCGERNKGLEKLKFKGWNESVKEGGGEGNLKKEKAVFGHRKRNSNDKKRVTQEWGIKNFNCERRMAQWMALKIKKKKKKKRDSSSGKKKEGIANVASHWSFKFVVCEFLPIRAFGDISTMQIYFQTIEILRSRYIVKAVIKIGFRTGIEENCAHDRCWFYRASILIFDAGLLSSCTFSPRTTKITRICGDDNGRIRRYRGTKIKFLRWFLCFDLHSRRKWKIDISRFHTSVKSTKWINLKFIPGKFL